ncbi:RNA polymerase sigma factor [Hymenobacter negativus]|uniref:RNA polymerase subunit sigma n=1 Tax=Hymenobacter negativus TaxID=2795026 RepID=A0ABS3QNV3_9BACT|nr:DUF6596 domain-containing protein [Hymenobacter negativus]MBO2012961.1 RNA polymerase subunit sigma [Hymenobacter negativus]
MDHPELLPHLFRTEYHKLVAVLARRFGFAQLETAEDLVSETFFTAAQTWGPNGLPPNPVAWLYRVAQNKATTHLQRARAHQAFSAVQAPNSASQPEVELSAQNIQDSQLAMMFAICHPALAPAAQMGLSLRVLCGFGIEEIAGAFLTNKETIQKRLFRAKAALRKVGTAIELPGPAQLEQGLEAVLGTIYLLFNEGYYSAHRNQLIRKELCFEAIRLATLLVENTLTARPEVYALLALMCFHASRLEARLDPHGDIIFYEQQDSSRWNEEWVRKGGYFLQRAAAGNSLSKYHLEAGLAFWSTTQADTPAKWASMLQLHDLLRQVDASPLAALSRTYVLAKVAGKQAAIAAAEQLSLTSHPLYWALLGELYRGLDDGRAAEHLRQAYQLAKSAPDKRAIQRKLIEVKKG